MKKIIIAGGGISGLSARYYLSKKHPDAEIILYEKSGKLGGCVHSESSPFFFERGPRTFKASRSAQLLSLIQELGLEHEITRSSQMSNRRYLWKDQKLRRPLTLVPKMIPALLKEWSRPHSCAGDESIESFAQRRFGSYVAETFFDPIALGIYAGDIGKLSMPSCFPAIKALEMEYGSLTRGFLKNRKKGKGKGLFTLRGGLSLLIQKLAEKGRGDIHLNTPLESLHAGAAYHVLALPAQTVKSLLYFDSEVRAFFDRLDAVNLSVVNVAYDKAVLRQKGFGYLVPSNQGEAVLGVVFDSCIFPEQNQSACETRLTVMLGGAFHPNLDPATAREKALASLRSHLNIRAVPTHCHVTHYPRAIPQYMVGHGERVEALEAILNKRYPHITCIGNYLHGVSINDCIRAAAEIRL